MLKIWSQCLHKFGQKSLEGYIQLLRIDGYNAVAAKNKWNSELFYFFLDPPQMRVGWWYNTATTTKFYGENNSSIIKIISTYNFGVREIEFAMNEWKKIVRN